jgi:hypothetical protein
MPNITTTARYVLSRSDQLMAAVQQIEKWRRKNQNSEFLSLKWDNILNQLLIKRPASTRKKGWLVFLRFEVNCLSSDYHYLIENKK